MRLEYSPFVAADLRTIARTIALDNPKRAMTFVQELRAKCRLAARNPEVYQLRPDLGNNIRASILGQYLILFRIEEDAVHVLRIAHGARDIRPLLNPMD